MKDENRTDERRKEILRALYDTDAEHQDVLAVSKCVTGLMNQLRTQALAAGKMPTRMYMPAPRNVVEQVGMEIFTDVIKNVPGAPIVEIIDYSG